MALLVVQLQIRESRWLISAHTHEPPGIVRAGCLFGRRAHKHIYRTLRTKKVRFCFLSRALARGFAAPSDSRAPALEGGRGVGDSPTNNYNERRSRTAKAETLTEPPPNRSPRFPLGGTGRGGKANPFATNKRPDNSAEEAVKKSPTFLYKNYHFVRLKTRCASFCACAKSSQVVLRRTPGALQSS